MGWAMTTAERLDAYLARIGCQPPAAPTLAALRSLHAAHVASIPFENLDVQMGRGVRLELDVIHDKFVTALRGGYCYEQNSLFADMLRTMGFDVRLCEARVRLGSPVLRARTHAVLAVLADGQEWLCDVGFGSDGLREPIALDGTPSYQEPWMYRVVHEGRASVLQSERAGAWVDLYALSLDGCHPVDYEMANWFTSTHPESRFVRSLTAQRILPHERRTLRDLTLTVTTTEGEHVTEIERGDLLLTLRELFGIELPEGTAFAALDRSAPRAGTATG